MINESEQDKIENILALMAEARGAAARALNAAEDSASRASYAADCIRKAQEQFTALTYRSPEGPRKVENVKAEADLIRAMESIVRRERRLVIEYVYGDGLWVINHRLAVGLLRESIMLHAARDANGE